MPIQPVYNIDIIKTTEFTVQKKETAKEQKIKGDVVFLKQNIRDFIQLDIIKIKKRRIYIKKLTTMSECEMN